MRNNLTTVEGDGQRAGNSLVSRVSEALRQAILNGTFPPGTKIPSEAQLSQMHGVSRTVVREAVAALRARGLIEARQGAGVFVLECAACPPWASRNATSERVACSIELLEIRTGVEVEAAGLAAVRRSPAQEEILFERHFAVGAAMVAGQPTGEADFQLHLAIAEATNNPRFRDFLAMVGQSAIPRTALAQVGDDLEQNSSYLKMIDSEHQRIIAAISAGDAAAAREAMRIHLLGSQSRYRALLQIHREHVRHARNR